MNIRIRPVRKGVWEVDIHTETPAGKRVRQRVHSPVSSKQATERWARERERVLALGLDTNAPEIPTLATFTDRYFAHWVTARRHKETGIATRKRAMTLHVLPVIGQTRLSEITEEMLGEIIAGMAGAQPRTVNGAISTLGAILRVAVRWRVIPALPCPIDLVKVPRQEKPFYDFDEFERLVSAAARIDWKAHLVALLGGRAGLRRGELLALRWVDVNLDRGTLTVRRQSTNGRISPPKGNHERTIDLAAVLTAAIEAHRHVRGELVICWDDGSPVCESSLARLANSAAKSAGLLPGVHILRHTYISHLAMRGVPMRTIMEMAGHLSLATTMAYAHLSPIATREGIAALDRGDVAEASKLRKVKSQGDNR